MPLNLGHSWNQEAKSEHHLNQLSNQIKATVRVTTIEVAGLENLCKKDDKYDSRGWYSTWLDP